MLNKTIIRFSASAAASILSGIILVFSFPAYNVSWVTWIGLVPLLLALTGNGLKQGFFLGFICAAVYFPGIFNWMLEVPGYTYSHHFVLGVYLGLYFGMFGLIFSLIFKRIGASTAMFCAPFLWVSLEFIRSNLFFLSLPLALLGHSQYENLQVIQMASLTGAYGVSFLVVLVNVGVASAIMVCCQSLKPFNCFYNIRLKRTGAVSIMACAAVLTMLVLTYGAFSISKTGSDEDIKISIIQGNIETEKKWDKKYAGQIMQTYKELSYEASENAPELIVWPEASTPGFVLKDLDLLNQIVSLIRNTKAYFLIGSSEYPKFQKISPDLGKVGNTALFFSPDGKLIGQYLKMHLVPFKEYVPLEGILQWPNFIVSKDKSGATVRGKEVSLFEFGKVKFGSVICWESLYPELFRKFVNNGANLIINIANEGWFGETTCPYYFLAANVFRAVENRISVVRAANTGISCFINPQGRVIARIAVNNKEIYVKGQLTNNITISKRKSFYTAHGDILAYASMFIVFVIVVFSLFKNQISKAKKHEQKGILQFYYWKKYEQITG